jgi:hypothetical protein
MRMSWMWRSPVGRPAGSTMKYIRSGPGRLSSMAERASAARMSGAIVLGLRVITSRTGTSRASGRLARMRLRSPSVMMPTSRPPASTTPVQPMLFSMISKSASRSVTVSATRGTSSPLRMSSRTVSVRRLPRMPLGWTRAKSSAVKPLRWINALASAWPMTRAAVVLVVGASPNDPASLPMWVSRMISLCSPR